MRRFRKVHCDDAAVSADEADHGKDMLCVCVCQQRSTTTDAPRSRRGGGGSRPSTCVARARAWARGLRSGVVVSPPPRPRGLGWAIERRGSARERARARASVHGGGRLATAGGGRPIVAREPGARRAAFGQSARRLSRVACPSLERASVWASRENGHIGVMGPPEVTARASRFRALPPVLTPTVCPHGLRDPNDRLPLMAPRWHGQYSSDTKPGRMLCAKRCILLSRSQVAPRRVREEPVAILCQGHRWRSG